MPPALPHEKLDAFEVSIALVTFAADLPPIRGAADTLDQLRRAATSVSLNIAEGVGKEGRERVRYFAIARGSALECAAAFRVLLAQRAVTAGVHEQGRRLCERLYAMLTRLVR